MDIQPINVNAQGVGSASSFGQKPKAKEEAKEEKITKQAPEGGPAKAPVDVLGFMAQQAVSVTPVKSKTVDPAKYVDSKSADRIADLMASFEDKVAQGLKAFNEEFGSDMSDNAKMAAVLSGINKEA